jgi:hypothetical protein
MIYVTYFFLFFYYFLWCKKGGVPQHTHPLDTTPFNQGTTNLSLHYATSAAGLPNWLGINY